jgi:hypothetical protein
VRGRGGVEDEEEEGREAANHGFQLLGAKQ